MRESRLQEEDGFSGGKPDRLQNILARAGVASRRGAAELVESGAVTVDGVVVREPGMRPADGAVVRVHGRRVGGRERHRTVVLYKPVGVVSTMSDPDGERTVADLVRVPERLVPAGRLDRDSEGMLVMSNDGALVNRLTHPRFGHEKTYIVKVAGRWSEEKLATLRSPLKMDDGYVIRPVPVEVVELRRDNTALAHLVVLSLKRVAIGGLGLPPELRPGEWRDLAADELALLTKTRDRCIIPRQ